MLKYNDYKALVEKHLLDFLPDIDNKSITVYEAMKYSLAAGGKRLRPVLMLATCDFCGGDVQQAIPFALSLEYIHTYSLSHDDMPEMDNDELRRGKPTNHVVFGQAMALLAGDGLLNSAFEAMGRDMMIYFDDPKELKRRASAFYAIAKNAGCRGMIAGQVADIEAENSLCSKEMLDYIHINKTAALIMASVRAGALLGGADSYMANKFEIYAENLGLAFQICDDILDVVGDEATLGKKVHADVNKSTYPALYGLEAARKRLHELTEAAAAALEDYEDEASFFIELARELEVRVK